MQIIVVVAVLAFMSAAILKLLLGRYATVSRNKRSIDAKSLVEACMAEKNLEWADTEPSSGFCEIDVNNTPGDTSDDVEVTVDVILGPPPNSVTYSVDYEDMPPG